MSCKVKDHIRDRILDLDHNLSSYGQFSAPVKLEEKKKKLKYYVNLGYAIRSLREDFPGLFYRELSFDFYRFPFPSFTFLIFICMVENSNNFFFFQG